MPSPFSKIIMVKTSIFKISCLLFILMKNNSLEKFDSIVENYSKSDRIAICHDLDADGISSGALTYVAIQKIRGKAPDLVITQSHKTVELLPKSLSMLKRKKIQKLVIVDFAFDQNEKSVLETEKIVNEILVIDHHTDYGTKSKKTFFLKVQKFSDIEPSKYPTSKAVYDLFSRHVDLSTHSWLACTGLMGDNQLSQWNDFVKEEANKHNSSVSELSKIVAIISGVEVLAPKKLHELLLFLAKCKKPSDVLKSKFAEYSKNLDKKIEKLLLDFEKKKIVFPEKELVWHEFKAKGNFKSELINRISNQIYPNMTVIVVQDKGDDWLLFSARRQDFKVKMNSLLEKAVSGLKGAGAGGHVPAAAGRVNKKDFEEFKKRILEQLDKK